MQKIFRPKPVGPPNAYETFRVAQPLSTHYRRATCAEIDCKAYREGWTFKLDQIDAQMMHVIKQSGKRYRRQELGNDVYLVFEPGQACFAARSHTIPLQRPPFFFRGKGDHRLFRVRKGETISFGHADDWRDCMIDRLEIIHRTSRKG